VQRISVVTFLASIRIPSVREQQSYGVQVSEVRGTVPSSPAAVPPTYHPQSAGRSFGNRPTYTNQAWVGRKQVAQCFDIVSCASIEEQDDVVCLMPFREW
jgi:hypothetical protein